MSWRYATREEAMAGHIALVNRLRARGIETFLERNRALDRILRQIFHGHLR